MRQSKSSILLVIFMSFFSSLGLAESCDFEQSEVGKKMTEYTYWKAAYLSCRHKDSSFGTGLSQKFSENSVDQLFNKAENYFSGSSVCQAKKREARSRGMETSSMWHQDLIQKFTLEQSKNPTAFCDKAKALLISGSPEKKIANSSATKNFAGAEVKLKQVQNKVSVSKARASTSYSYSSQYSQGLSGSSSRAYTNSYANLLPAGNYQPLFMQTFVNQIIFVPGVGYRSVVQPVVVPLSQGVY